MGFPAISNNRSIFVISDLHLGSGGSRDGFSDPVKKQMLFSFLDMVEKSNGSLIVLGDLMDLWRFRLKRVVRAHADILDRLYELGAFYILGNHDLAMGRVRKKGCLSHPLLSEFSSPISFSVGGKNIRFLHGHEVDHFNGRVRPCFGRGLGISAFPIEWLRGKQVFSSESIAEFLLKCKVLSFCMFRRIAVFLRLGRRENKKNLGFSGLFEILNRRRGRAKIGRLVEQRRGDDDIIITGHTHKPTAMSGWYFNSGCWTGGRQNFLEILPTGLIQLYNWTNNGPARISQVKSCKRDEIC